MARKKQVPLRREPSDFSQGPPDSPGRGWKNSSANANADAHLNGNTQKIIPAAINGSLKEIPSLRTTEQPGLPQLLICVAGIYASLYTPPGLLEGISAAANISLLSLSWALLQERITATPYGSPTSPEKFTYSVFLNTVQSTFAALTGYIYLLTSTSRASRTPSIFPSRSILFPLILVAITSSLASPFGYASLAHIDYITFILAKSCKLLPVMFLHLTIFRKNYPLYKYLVVALVTAGVAVFTLHHPASSSKKSSSTTSSSTWGLILLGINLLFDGLTNSTQDHIFATYRPYSGPQMMVAQNLLSTLLTTAYMLLSPSLAAHPLASTIGLSPRNANEFFAATAFIRRNPSVGPAILGFAACGAVGQIFIYYTLSHFSSLLLVTVTVTRKMLTMILSVLWFGHRLTGMQWVGVGLVFGGVGAEGVIQRREKAAKERARGKGKGKGKAN